jgi:predicted Zn-dependent protease
MGHEVAHVQNHHGIRRQQDTFLLSLGSQLAMLLSAINPGLGLGLAGVGKAKMLEYARRLEEEADYRGLQYMKKAGFDPRGMPAFFKKMARAERLGPSHAPAYLRSHPMSQKRLSYIESTLKTFRWDRSREAGTDFALERVQAILRATAELRQRVVPPYEERLTRDPRDPRAAALLGTVLLYYREFGRARELLEQAGAGGIDVSHELALAHWHLGDLDRARRVLAEKTEVDPDDASAQAELGKVLFHLGENDLAREACRRALALDPFQEEAHRTIALVYGHEGAEGKKRYHLGIAYMLQGRPEAALSQLKQAKPLLAEDSPEAEDTLRRIKDLSEIPGSLRRKRAGR